MAKGTPATLALEKAGVAFTTATYSYDPDAPSVGLQAAAAMGVSPGVVLKTLMAEVDGRPVCVIVPADREVSMKRLASAFRGKSAQMMKPADAERITGYKVGGISPFGQKRQFPTAIEASAMTLPEVYMNGGQRGLQVKLAPADAARVLDVRVAALIAD